MTLCDANTKLLTFHDAAVKDMEDLMHNLFLS